ncbi:hypothetical protein C8Q74DRAFT_1271245 [Fomes fomentarius]|nr:hypothetical protein C8Q74DRAFT_1271245 [Fomes fomentarius]
MADPLQYRLSNSSDDSPLQEDISDSEHESPPLDDADDIVQTLDPRNSQLSLVSGAGHSLDDRRHRRRSLTHRDFFRTLVDEGVDARKHSKLLRAALGRLDTETRRAQEAERRALELAQRFKIVNEARLSAQAEVERVHAELRMYKVQLDNAQREILRGSDLLKDIEAQRDSAEEAAARARSTARRLKEEQLMMKAREEGRKQGYQEGLRRGYQQARGGALMGSNSMFLLLGVGPSRAGDRVDPLDGMAMMNLSSPPRTLADAAAEEDPYGAGAQGSRFREMMMTPSTLRSGPLPPAQDEPRYIRPTPMHNPPSSPSHADYYIPPDGYIPSLGPDNVISMPPPHEMERQPSMSSVPPSSASATDEPRSAPPINPRDYAYMQRHRSSPQSFADSFPSTTISQFDIVNTPNVPIRGPRERSSGLSAIPEVSSTMEYSPGMSSRVRSAILPEVATFPMPDDVLGNEPSIPHTRSKELNQRIANELRYSDPDQMEQWRQSTASQSQPSSSRERLYTPHRPSHVTTPSPLGGPSIPAPSPATPTPTHRRTRSVQSPPSDGRSYAGAGSGSGTHRRTSSSTPISIRIEPPSGPGSNYSLASVHDDMLSPRTSHRTMPPTFQPIDAGTPTPDRPDSRGYSGGAHPYTYGNPVSSSTPYYNAPPSHTPVPTSSPRHTPDPTRGYAGPGPSYPYASSSSSVGQQVLGRPKSRAASADYSSGVGAEYAVRPRTPSAPSTSGRSPSAMAMGGDRPPSARPITPGSLRVLRSPSRASSRQSLQPDPYGPARPSSRASADHQRTLSMHAGSTPAIVSRPLSGSQQVRRVPSGSSMNSENSRKSGYQRYDPSEYMEPALLASSEDLTSMQSPNTMANTRANSAWMGPGPSRLRPSSPSMSYASGRS